MVRRRGVWARWFAVWMVAVWVLGAAHGAGAQGVRVGAGDPVSYSTGRLVVLESFMNPG